MWIIKDDVSHAIISCNTHQEGDFYQLWVTRPNDKNLMIMESKNKEEITMVKEALDYAIEHGKNALHIA